MEMFFVILNLTVFIIYNILIIRKFNIPESLSETTYLMGNKYWVFPLICGLFVFTILPIWLNIPPHNFNYIKFFSCGGLLFVGATPFFKQKFEGKIHYVAAIISLLGFISWFLLNGLYIWVLIDLIIFICSILILNKKNFVYYGEVITWITLLIFLLTLGSTTPT